MENKENINETQVQESESEEKAVPQKKNNGGVSNIIRIVILVI